MKLLIIAIAFTSVVGCTHIADLQACQPPVKSPKLFTEALGWDHRSIDDVRCSNEALQAQKVAREASQSNIVVR